MKLLVIALAIAAVTPAFAERVATRAAPRRLRPSPPPPPVVFSPPREIAVAAQPMLGKWTCKGVQMVGDGSSQPAHLALEVTLDADRAWIQTVADEMIDDRGTPVGSGAEGRRGSIDGKSVLKYSEFRSYDAVSHAWTRFEMANTTAMVTSTSTGEDNDQWTWTGTLHGTTDVEVRDFEKRFDDKHLEMWGDERLAGTWQKVYQFSCVKTAGG